MPDDDLVVTEDRTGPVPVVDEGVPQPASRNPLRRRALLVAAVVVAALVAGYVVVAVATAGRLPRGTSVAGVDLGGLGREAAVQRLKQKVAAADSVVVTAGGRRATLRAAADGLVLDPERTVDAAFGSTFAPGSVWRHLAGGGPVDVGASGNRPVLEAALRRAARTLDVAPRDGSITLAASGATARPARTGSAVDVAAAVDVVASRWLSASGPVELPVRTAPPRIAQAEVDRALQEVARPAISGPLAVTVGDRTVEVPVERLVKALAVRPAGDKLALDVDGRALEAAVRAVEPDVEVPAKDARVELRGGKPVVVPAVDGKGIDPETLAERARTALLSDDRTVAADLRATPAKLTTAEAQGLGIKERVSTFSTNYPPLADRTNNLRIAARTVNGTLVLPGEVFSLNKVLGRRTPEKGYRSAPVINGGRLQKDFGGGVSQMATTIFNNVFFAGLEDVHHMAHSFYISRYPEGREATVSYPTVDLKWRNDTPYGVLVQASVTDTVNVSFWSTKVWDVEAEKSARTNFRAPKTIHDPRPGCVPQEPSPGFDVVVTRIFKKKGEVVKRQRFFTSYIAEDHVICGPDPAKAKPKPPADAGTTPGVD